MKTCDMCGEPIPPHSGVCPYCESPQSVTAASARSGEALRTLNIEAGMPTVAEAMQRLRMQLDRAQADGVRLVRVIHGWGSNTGGRGKIRTAARRWLQQQLEDRQIRSLVLGDHYTHTSPEGRDFQRRHPALRISERTDRENPGICFIEL
jgi:uncharacterized Zn finger protein (UPF0148 family)